MNNISASRHGPVSHDREDLRRVRVDEVPQIERERPSSNAHTGTNSTNRGYRHVAEIITPNNPHCTRPGVAQLERRQVAPDVDRPEVVDGEQRKKESAAGGGRSRW